MKIDGQALPIASDQPQRWVCTTIGISLICVWPHHTVKFIHVHVQCAKLSVLIFRKLLRDNPKVLASFVRSGLDKKDVQFIEEMIDHDDESSDFPKVCK